MRILLITPVFYGYEIKIKSELEKQGHEVCWIENKDLPFDFHGTYSKLQILRKLYNYLFSPQKRYIKNELKYISNHSFDLLFSVNGHIICRYLFEFLKKQNPDVYSILFLWDSFEKYNWEKEIAFFDKVYTFDKKDSEKYSIEYKPNFYISSDNYSSSTEKYDLFFAGKFSPYRLTLIENILQQTETLGMSCFFRLWPAFKLLLHNRLIFRLLKRIKFRNRLAEDYVINYEAFEGILKHDYLVNKSMNYQEMQSNMLRSNVILDLPFQLQTGYSHRLIEALANGKKIITTNKYLRNETFYNEDQIHIIEDYLSENDFNWIKKKILFSVSEEIIGLEITNWLNLIINARGT